MASFVTQEMEMADACRQFQAMYDTVLCQPLGVAPPTPKVGQDVMEYRTEACRAFKRTYLPPAHESYKVNYRGLVDDPKTLGILERKLLADCLVEAKNPAHVPKGQFREIVTTGPDGMKIHKFIGQESFVKAMGRQNRRVVSFNTDRGPMDSTGRYMR
jgi:hypothetical protein